VRQRKTEGGIRPIYDCLAGDKQTRCGRQQSSDISKGGHGQTEVWISYGTDRARSMAIPGVPVLLLYAKTPNHTALLPALAHLPSLPARQKP